MLTLPDLHERFFQVDFLLRETRKKEVISGAIVEKKRLEVFNCR